MGGWPLVSSAAVLSLKGELLLLLKGALRVSGIHVTPSEWRDLVEEAGAYKH